MARSLARHEGFWMLFGALGLALCAGCGSGGESGPTGTVSGTVTFNGQPVPPGTTVAFISDEGQTAAGLVEEDGEYQLSIGGKGSSIPAVAYRVTVSPPAEEELSEAEYDAMMQAAGSGARRTQPPATKPAIPANYQSAATSGLSYTVTEGDNTIDIELVETAPSSRQRRR
ncbi:MAG: hypothetical protein GXY83_11855 [Rhodopirellula sp.]|nr:hypothetical protein [Rhodopirellula sp.]